MDNLEIAALPMSAVVAGLVQVLRSAFLKSRYAPLAAVIIGIACAWAADAGEVTKAFDGNVARIILGGAIVGLASSGLYSNVKMAFAGSRLDK